MNAIWTVAMLSLLATPATTYKILIAPFFSGFNSRLLNMQKMADMLAQDGHEVDMIMNNRVKDHIIMKHANILNFNIPEHVKDAQNFTLNELNFDGLAVFKTMQSITEMQALFCESLFEDKLFIKRFQETDYDLVIADMLSLCSGILSSHLNVTTIFYQNFGFYPDSAGFYPLFPSFTCLSSGIICVTDDMIFIQKVLNTLLLGAFNYYLSPMMINMQNDVVKKTGIDVKLPLENILEDKIILANVDYVLETPRPKMPHVVTISGLFHKKPLPLSPFFQKIVNQSTQHGLILMSFGTAVPKFEEEKAEKFANVLGKLKQQVIWRYIGEKPKGLKNNTHLTEWFPQNDLLANPATKLFITHCGISSTFESAYNAVPVIAVPLFGDQVANAAKLTDRVKIGVQLDFHSFTEMELENGIQEVLTNPMYKENARRAALTMSDQVVSPVQQFRHLVNFTIKTEGAKHLFHPYAVKMSWFTYFSLDVVTFLLGVFTLALFLCACLFKLLCKCCRIAKMSSKRKLKKS